MNSQGTEAEDRAAIYLQQQGLKLLTRNYRSRFGEIDLIMRDGSSLVFVEVRMRKSDRFGGAAASITAAKQQKLTLTASQYLQQHGNSACRFDAILLDQAYNIVWIRNAFEA
ncbi:MAG TPA: YraN family protein [Methylovorus sp.]|nr:YraN family protein [Methylovorus sp.]